jgi:hypothetical protein
VNGFSQSFAQRIENGGFGDDAAAAAIFGSPLVFGANVTGGRQDGKAGAHPEDGNCELFLF